MPEIILFGYPTSPYYQKVILVLNFLQLPFSICPQPRMLPRPDLTGVGITYRRIPLLSIDGHVYADTNLIIDELCRLTSTPNHRETEALGNAMFPFCAMLIPYKMIADPAFLEDRTALTGRPWTESRIVAQRPYAASQFLAHLAIIQQLLAQGGGFVRDGKVTMADLHIAFVVQWVLLGHRGAEREVSTATHPEVYTWLNAIKGAVKHQKPGKVSFENVVKSLTSAQPRKVEHDDKEPLGLKVGSTVAVTPVDTGKSHPQIGKLLAINSRQVCIQTSGSVHVSFPRVNYMISAPKDHKI